MDFPAKPTIFFDGICNLCSGFVQFMIGIDPGAKFQYASLQSEAGQAMLKQFNMPTQEINTVVLLHQGQIYTHADVALQIARLLGGWYRLFLVFSVFPRPLRNVVYNWIARNRYRWFGKSESCMIPTPELKSRFL
jgi:predicted DCC family thiol-disulfide oxidoreductase YuxK